MAFFYILGTAIGLFLIVAAVLDWDLWFVDSQTWFVGLIAGEDAARWSQGIVGAGIIVVTLLSLLQNH